MTDRGAFLLLPDPAFAPEVSEFLVHKIRGNRIEERTYLDDSLDDSMIKQRQVIYKRIKNVIIDRNSELLDFA